MRCPRCDTLITMEESHCRYCGQNLSVIHRAVRCSNAYYNIGLEKARVRDLTGAIQALQKCLHFNKHHQEARNLLGLVLFEMGEVTTALCQWLISSHYSEENHIKDNVADHYIRVVSRNLIGLDQMKNAIKRYNKALFEAQTGNDDVAIIQLRKVITLHPNFVRALQLITLLYIKNKEYAKATKCLKQIRKIDFNNTVMLRYMHEIGSVFAENNRETENHIREIRQQVRRKNSLENVKPVGAYQEDKRKWMPFVYAGIGFIIALIVCLVLILPTVKGKTVDANSNFIANSNEKLSVKDAQLSMAEKEKKELQNQVNDLEEKVKKADKANEKEIKVYTDMMEGIRYYLNKDKVLAAAYLYGHKEEDYPTSASKEIYRKIYMEFGEDQLESLYNQGVQYFEGARYEDGAVIFKLMLKIQKDHADALYFLGRCYQMQQNTEKAKEYYNKVIALNKERVNESKERLQEMGVSPEKTAQP